MTRRERIDAMIRDVLNPLLEKDGGSLELASFEGSVLSIRLMGTLHGCPGTAFVKRGVIEPAMRSVVGPEVEIVYQRPNLVD